jgi:hypothetical protein
MVPARRQGLHRPALAYEAVQVFQQHQNVLVHSRLMDSWLNCMTGKQFIEKLWLPSLFLLLYDSIFILFASDCRLCGLLVDYPVKIFDAMYL